MADLVTRVLAAGEQSGRGLDELLGTGFAGGFAGARWDGARTRPTGSIPDPLIAMLFLCCGGITLDPPLPAPTET